MGLKFKINKIILKRQVKILAIRGRGRPRRRNTGADTAQGGRRAAERARGLESQPDSAPRKQPGMKRQITNLGLEVENRGGNVTKGGESEIRKA